MAEELRRVSAEPSKDAAELFGRMVFNALISNTDDHPRNHALIAKDNLFYKMRFLTILLASKMLPREKLWEF